MVNERAKAIGVNHITLEVADIDKALFFYAELFEFSLRMKTGLDVDDPTTAIAEIVLGDQFIKLVQSNTSNQKTPRHFGIVVDNLGVVERTLQRSQIEILPGEGINFRDPWGNLVQVVDYSSVEFLKSDVVLSAMDITEIEKSEKGFALMQAGGFSQ
jgi:catechol 2,3-dioxygenase-like lactoylglutathione lyase family enzyme